MFVYNLLRILPVPLAPLPTATDNPAVDRGHDGDAGFAQCHEGREHLVGLRRRHLTRDLLTREGDTAERS